MYDIGDYIQIIHMDGEPRYDGRCGFIWHIDDIGQLHGSWGGCAVDLKHDEIRLIEKKRKVEEEES